jgi:hypothetical protein
MKNVCLDLGFGPLVRFKFAKFEAPSDDQAA